ncbi:MAG: Holliday junction branch migration protein RuvA [Patescibacteria group bacterium]
MIGFIRGPVLAKNERAVIIDTGGVGYSVFVPQPLLHTAATGQALAIYTYTHVREDVLELYGLPTLADIDLFRQLISVSGVGPRSALAIFDIADHLAISQAIASGDLRFLTTVSGIGKKTAELIIVKLQDKQTLSAQVGTSGGEAIEALVSLGYSVVDARDALLRLPASLTGTAERVTAALKLLSKH